MTDKNNNFMTNGQFDLNKFNSAFSGMINETKLTNAKKDKKILDKLNKVEEAKNVSLYNMSVVDFVIGIKDTWFNVLDDLLRLKLNKVFEDNNLFFIGLTFILIAIFMYLYYDVFNEK